MKKVYLFILLFIGVAIISCEKSVNNELVTKEESVNRNIDTFFENDVKDSNLEFAITYLKTVKSSSNFVDSVRSIYGEPLWSKYDSYNSDKQHEYLIPFVNIGEKQVNSFMVINLRDGQMRTGFVSRKDFSNIEQLWRFDFLTQQVFGIQKDYVFKDSDSEYKETDNTVIAAKTSHETKYDDECSFRYISVEGGGEYYFYIEEKCRMHLIDVVERQEEYTDDNIKQGEGGGDGNVGGGSHSNPTIIDEFKLDKAKCIKDKLMVPSNGKESLMSTLLNAFKDKNGVKNDFNVTFRMDSLVGDNGLAIFDKKGNDQKVTILINYDRLSKSALEVAKTMLHEAFHAYIYACVYPKGDFEYLVGDGDFTNTFKEYKLLYERTHPKGTLHHNWMADKYISFMKEGLKEFFKDDAERFKEYMDWDDKQLDLMYEYLAWSGLKNTSEWDKYDKKDEQEAFMKNSMIMNSIPKTCK